MSKQAYNTNWNQEYGEDKGIPSSHRETPSAALIWGLEVIQEEHGRDLKGFEALDVGCGGGRNALFMAGQGAHVRAFDGSHIAIEQAKNKLPEAESLEFFNHDLNKGLPCEDHTVDLITDIFVYKHQINSEDRKAYRNEIHRALKPDGFFLLSLADAEDGYYGNCPDVESADPNNLRTIIDPPTQIGSVLFSLDALKTEFGDTFNLLKSWQKKSKGPMHGGTYERVILTTLWGPKS